ncbi:MAG TPA: hypothetical protein VK157_09915 [Phycisphaerales bacterium]|nr:hypothetical protein [Phycisphaerales bacterium]
MGRKPYLDAFEEIEIRRLQSGPNVPITNADKRELIFGLSEEIAKDAVSGTIDSRRTFGYNEWRNFFDRMGPSWKRSQPDLHVEINHGVPQKHFSVVLRQYMTNQNANVDVPSFPFKYERHGAGKGAILDAAGNEIGYEATFHDVLEGNASRGIASLRPPVTQVPATDAANMRQALRRVYNDMHDAYSARDNVDYRAMGDLVDEFLARNGVP